MSNITGASSSSGNDRARGRFTGVPKTCWCGEKIIEKMSKSEANPYRRYFRCAFAATNKLIDDNHIFKWVDEAILNELDALSVKMSKLESKVESLGNQRISEIEMKMETEIVEMQFKLEEAKNSMKRMMILVICLCIVMLVAIKLVG